MRKLKKSIIVLSFIAMILSLQMTALAAPKISQKSITLLKGQSTTLKITGTKNKVAWSSNKKSVASVSGSGKVVAKKKGSSTITAKVGGG